MPWYKESKVSQRQRLIEQMLLPGANVSALCREAGISRKTAYKWLARYDSGDLRSLVDHSKARRHQSQQTNKQVESIIINSHHENPYWGPEKLRSYLINSGELKSPPTHTTIGNILKRNDCEVIKSQKSQPAKTRFEREVPNELWQMDFKGSYMTGAHRCYPLTILDDYSRFSVGLVACRNEKRETVQTHLTTVFKRHGLPEQINVDNGNPWGSSDLTSLTSLQIWLIKLGIRLSHSAPYHPQTNGKDERFHRTLKLELLHDRQYRSTDVMQEHFDQWQHRYNFTRPHAALDGKTPSSRYHQSVREFPDKLIQAEYDDDDCDVRKVVKNTGRFAFRGKHYYASRALGDEYIAIRETQVPDVFAIFFMTSFLKKFNLNEAI